MDTAASQSAWTKRRYRERYGASASPVRSRNICLLPGLFLLAVMLARLSEEERAALLADAELEHAVLMHAYE